MAHKPQLAFDDRVAIVTGGGSGMGREHALSLASRGARVVVNDFNLAGAQETVDAITSAGGQAVVNGDDIVVDAKNLVDNAIEAFGQLDIVINNAGIARFGRFWEMDGDQWWKVFDTHLRGTVEVSRHAMPHLIKSGTGRLINISSSAMLGAALATPYSAAKAAIWGLGNSLAKEAREVGVKVTTVQPSAWTPMTEGAFDNPAVRKVLREKLPASAVAAFVTWLAHQDTYVFGDCFQVSGVSGGRTVFAAMSRIQVPEATPEAWAEHADALMEQRDLNPLHDTDESFRAELVFLDPSMDAELPRNASAVSDGSTQPR